MEMGYIFNPQIDLKTEPDFQFESLSEEDDIFYAELEKQILLLTAEEDDENDNMIKSRNLKYGRRSEQSLNNAITISEIPGSYYSWCENYENGNSGNVPIWLLNLWKHGSGTGVFIPHIPKTRRRRKKQGRSNSSKGTVYVPVQPNKNK